MFLKCDFSEWSRESLERIAEDMLNRLLEVEEKEFPAELQWKHADGVWTSGVYRSSGAVCWFTVFVTDSGGFVVQKQEPGHPMVDQTPPFWTLATAQDWCQREASKP